MVGLHLGNLNVPEPLLDEINDATREELGLLGITILEPTFEQLGIAATHEGPLSFNDHLCLQMAKDLRHTCITNDKALLKACAAEGVPTIRGLRLLLNLVSKGVMTKKRALQVANLIHISNPHHIPVRLIEELKAKLDTL